MCPFRSLSFRKVKDGGDRPYSRATQYDGCICEVNKHHLKWMTNAIVDK